MWYNRLASCGEGKQVSFLGGPYGAAYMVVAPCGLHDEGVHFGCLQIRLNQVQLRALQSLLLASGEHASEHSRLIWGLKEL